VRDTLAAVNKVQLNLNLWTVTQGEAYQIVSAKLNAPKIHAKVLKNGLANLDNIKIDSNVKPTNTPLIIL